jgi:hypothetical protein
VVAHFYCFVRKQFLAAALIICVGVYFKLYPIVFMFPFFLFSVLSREHRRYAACLAGSALLIALASLPVAGWAFGFWYPLAMFRSILAEPAMIPLRSKEVFGPLFFITRLFSSFNVRSVDPAAAALGRTLASAVAILLLASTTASAVVLRCLEPRWNRDGATRQLALFIFQSAIGFLMVSFSPDLSVTLLLPVLVSLYAPLWVYADSVCPPRWNARTAATLSLFVIGMTLAGNLLPLSVLLRILPFGSLDRLSGNAPAALIAHEKYLWYQVPMIGVYCLAASFWCALRTIDRENPIVQSQNVR